MKTNRINYFICFCDDDDDDIIIIITVKMMIVNNGVYWE